MPGASPRIFEWGVESSAGWPTYPKIPQKSEKHRILTTSFSNLGASNDPIFKSAGVRTPDPPSATPLIIINPRRHRGGGVAATPMRFFWNIFFIYRSNATIFSIAFRPYGSNVTIFSIDFRPFFSRPPENLKILTLLIFNL